MTNVRYGCNSKSIIFGIYAIVLTKKVRNILQKLSLAGSSQKLFISLNHVNNIIYYVCMLYFEEWHVTHKTQPPFISTLDAIPRNQQGILIQTLELAKKLG